GNNTWQGPINLADNFGIFPKTDPGNTVSFGVRPGTQLTINGPISEAAPSFSLNKVNTGKLILQQNNTYSGSTTVSAGVLNIQASGALGVGGAAAVTMVVAGASLEMQGNITTP